MLRLRNPDVVSCKRPRNSQTFDRVLNGETIQDSTFNEVTNGTNALVEESPTRRFGAGISQFVINKVRSDLIKFNL